MTQVRRVYGGMYGVYLYLTSLMSNRVYLQIAKWRYGKVPINGTDLDDDIYQNSNYQKIIYINDRDTY